MSGLGNALAERQSSTTRWVRPSTPEDGPAIVALMRAAGLEPHFDPAHLDWKYWRERPDWEGSRSYVLTDGSGILAHVAVVPGFCRWGAARYRVVCPIDWAARTGEIGAGTLLMKHVGHLADFLLAIGGTEHALRVMPLIGYEPCGVVSGYARPLSALAPLKRPSRPWWRLAGRFARSAFWWITAPRTRVDHVGVRRIRPEDLGRAPATPAEKWGSASFERTDIAFRHLLACPIVPMELCVVETDGRGAGHFLMSYTPSQARLADCWIDSDDPAEWRALIQLAVRHAKQRTGLAEIVSWSSDPLLSRSLEGCGFHRRRIIPMYLRSSHGLEIPKETPRVQMVESDACYLQSGQNELWV